MLDCAPNSNPLFHFCPNLARQFVSFLLVKVCTLAACLAMLAMHLEVCASSGAAPTVCYGQDKMACHLHSILCTWDAVYHLRSSHCFLSTWGEVMLKKQLFQNLNNGMLDLGDSGL